MTFGFFALLHCVYAFSFWCQNESLLPSSSRPRWPLPHPAFTSFLEFLAFTDEQFYSKNESYLFSENFIRNFFHQGGIRKLEKFGMRIPGKSWGEGEGRRGNCLINDLLRLQFNGSFWVYEIVKKVFVVGSFFDLSTLNMHLIGI